MTGHRSHQPIHAPPAQAPVMAGADAGKSTRTAAARGAPPAGEGEACWHALDAAAVLARLGSGPSGLADTEHARRLAVYGPNLPEGRRKREPWWEELGESFTEPLQLLLIAVAVLSAVFGELRDAIAIAAIIAAVAVTETVTEVRAGRAIEALRAMTAPTARLQREGYISEVPAASLVPGDVVAVGAGDVVPADARVLAARGLRVDESTLTGEAAPVGKSEQPVPAATGLAGRSSLLHAGTAVLAGEGTAVVVATGQATGLGKLGRLAAGTREPPTPLQKAMSQLARAVLVAAIAASVLVPAVGLAAGQPWRDMLLAGLTVAFATVPEELPILITLLLALGGRQLARQGALLRRLRAGETLGAVTTLVTDKTGTLTENRLCLATITGDRRAVLATAVASQPQRAARREPMETELARAAAGIAPTGPEVAAFPFDPVRKLVSRARKASDGAIILAVSGAPEAVLARCTLGPADRAGVTVTLAQLTGDGQRVIGFARRHLSGVPADRDTAETGLDYVGLAAFTDPLRYGVPAAVATLTTAGVSTVVVTGDHPATAAAVAAQAGLPASQAIEGGDAETMPDTELQSRLRHGAVIARATPSLKHRIVQLLQRRGEIVAVTGDGANDAPALAAANVGIALGRRGADLARAAAGIILTNDAYPTVTTAIAKGRNITAQLRRAVAFYLGAKLALVAILVTALAAGLPIPFQPVHIVLLELFMDLGASVAFAAEPTAPAAMHRPPRPPGTGFLDRSVLAAITTTAAALTLAALPAYLILAHTGATTGQARAAAVLAWLAAHALIAWMLRTQPALPWRANPAFPAWALAAIAAGITATLTPASQLIGLQTLPLHWLPAITGLVVIATAAAYAASRTPLLARRL